MIIVPDTRHQIQRINLETMSLGLLGAYISSSSDSESDSQDEIQDKEVSPKKPAVPLQNPFNNPEVAKVQLPKPSFMQEQVEKIEGKSTVENSVFKNPFRDAENQKTAMLERHVEMTTKPEAQREINGKKICWNFRKGRCRFGAKCTFAHDNDVAKSNITQGTSKSQGLTEADEDGVIAESNKRPKKRPGLSSGLELSKKALKFHNKVYNQ